MLVAFLQDTIGPSKLVGVFESKEDTKNRIIDLYNIKIGHII